MARRISLVEVSSRRRRVRRSLFWGAIIGLIIALIGGGIWFVARSKAFTVREVKIDGPTYIPQDDIRAFIASHVAQGLVSRWLGPQNLLTWPRSFSGDVLAADMPALTSLTITKDYLHRTATVKVQERTRVGEWCFEEKTGEDCYWFDDRGTLFLAGYPAEGNLIPILRDYSRASLPLGAAALPQKFVPNLLTIFSALQATDVSVREVRLDDLGLEEVRAETYDGPELLFSLRFSAAPAAGAITALEKITPLSKLQYVDFRVENKVYYK